MIRKAFFLRQDQIDFIKTLAGDASGHVRLALDQYIEKKKQEKSGVSYSPSKKGDFRGRIQYQSSSKQQS